MICAWPPATKTHSACQCPSARHSAAHWRKWRQRCKPDNFRGSPTMSEAQTSWNRFLHAFGFADATDDMVEAAKREIDAALAGLQEQSARLAEVGLGIKALSNQHKTLFSRKGAANNKPTNNERYAELCKVKADAQAALESAKEDVEAQL